MIAWLCEPLPSNQRTVQRGPLGSMVNEPLLRLVWCFISISRVSAAVATVVIVETNDVVFAEITATLNLYHLKWDEPDVFEPMFNSERHIGRLVLRKQKRLVAMSHACSTVDYDPVLRTMIMKLERQRRTRRNDN